MRFGSSSGEVGHGVACTHERGAASAPHLDAGRGALTPGADAAWPQNHYVERLHKMYLYCAPAIFSGVWAIVSPFVSALPAPRRRCPLSRAPPALSTLSLGVCMHCAAVAPLCSSTP